MAPTTAKPATKQNSASSTSKGLSGFFAAQTTKKTTKTTLVGKSSQQAIEISDESGDDRRPVKSATKSATSQPSTSKPKPLPTARPASQPKPKPTRVDTSGSDSDSNELLKAKQNKALAKKRKSVASSDDEDEEEEEPPKKKAAKSPRKSETNGKVKSAPKPAPPKPIPVTKKKVKDDDYEDEPEPEEKPKPKVLESTNKSWAAAKAAEIAKASKGGWRPGGAPGGSGGGGGKRAIPQGKPNCLAGLTFVFTGELSGLSREEAQDAAKRYGGRVTGAPSKKTSYVVVGENAGPKKLETIAKLGLKILDEDGFVGLIASREGVMDEATIEKMRKEEEKIKKEAKEMEERERQEAAKAAASKQSGTSVKVVDTNGQLWTSKYAPRTLKDMCGNKGQVEKLNGWLANWGKAHKDGFKKPGKDAMGTSRAVLLSGPPGVGKTTSAHLVAKLNGYTVIEVNASDARNKKLLESSTNITNRSLDGWLGGQKATNVAGVEIHGKPCLIMDEVDGMSAGDRGGVGALNALIKKTDIPIICIANDRNLPKMKPLWATTFNLSFRRPSAAEIRSRMMSIAHKEKLKLNAASVDQLVAGSNSDIRQVLNMMSTWKLTHDALDFDESRDLSSMNEKHFVMTPFTVMEKMFGPYMFSQTSNKTLNDKMDMYFHDFTMMPLMVQENYLKTQPRRVQGLDGPDLVLKRLELMDKAASAISDGDLVDAMIHSPEQHWSLMPLHAVHSLVRPAYQVYGNMQTWGGPNAMTFPSWLGQNSKQGKLRRELGEVQIRMRLKVTGDKAEIREHYVPALYPSLIKRLIDDGAEAIPEVIETMDEYFLSKEEWDYIVELGVGDRAEESVLKGIATATKTAFTRKYNSTEHPVAFHKATLFGGKAKTVAAAGPAPDVEDAYDIEDEAPAADDEGDDDDDESQDVTKDKLIKQSKAKKPAAKQTKAKGKAAK